MGSEAYRRHAIKAGQSRNLQCASSASIHLVQTLPKEQVGMSSARQTRPGRKRHETVNTLASQAPHGSAGRTVILLR